ncbi:MAG TPA: ABC transporter permease subunit [Bradyrhizobium sp.]|nr:ABC transporter permease subunit [Bradyrhizobium sp.]
MTALRNGVPALVTVLTVLVIWQGAFNFGLVSLISLPTPWGIVNALVDLVLTGALFGPFFHTLWIVVVGSACALAIGTILGAVLGLSRSAYRWGMASVDFMRTIPVVALLPVAVMLWGPSTQSELIITVYAATWVMAVNTAGAFATVHARLGDVASVFRLTRLEAVAKVWLPSIASSLLVGARLSTVTAALAAIIAETLVNPHGLGWEIVRAQQALQPARLWAYALVAGSFGYFLNGLLIRLAQLLLPGHRANVSASGA